MCTKERLAAGFFEEMGKDAPEIRAAIDAATAELR